MANEEIIMKLGYLEQQSEETKKNIETVEEQMKEMEALKLSLEKLDNGKEKDNEILTNLGRGIFLKTKVDDSKVFVNVGSRIFVRKNFGEASEIVDKQVLELDEIKHQLIYNIEAINLELQKLVEEAQKKE